MSGMTLAENVVRTDLNNGFDPFAQIGDMSNFLTTG